MIFIFYVREGIHNTNPQILGVILFFFFRGKITIFSQNQESNFFNHFLIEVQLIYNIVLVSGVQQGDSVLYIYVCVYIFFFRFSSIIGYYKTLNIVPCAI